LGLGAAQPLGGVRQAQLILGFAISDGTTPVLGASIGHTVAARVGDWSRPLGPLLLLGYGVYVFAAARWARRGVDERATLILLGLPVSLSVDNLVAGTTLGVIGLPLYVCAPVMGAFSGGMALIGLQTGRATARLLRLDTELVGAATLILLAVTLTITQ
jgi:putative Mn2+ efflux pump MntP